MCLSLTELSIVNVSGVLSEDISSKARKIIKDLTGEANPKPFEALLMDDTLIISNNKKITEHSKIYITNPKVKTDYVQRFDPIIQEEIVKIKVKFDLNQTEMKKLSQNYNADMKLLKGQKEDLHLRLALIEERAKEIKIDGIVKKLIGNLIKKRVEIKSVMNEITLNKICFSDESMAEVLCNLEDLSIEMQGYLEANITGNVQDETKEINYDCVVQ